MKLRMLVGLAGSISLKPGDEHDFPNGEAMRLIDAGYAIPLAEVKIETAIKVPPAETRAKPKRKK